MAATAQQDWSYEEDRIVSVSLDEARAHDEYWAQSHRFENYYRTGLDYEDYAPAFCVGYVGRLQYGGAFDDAEKSLLSNWIRIKGDSRLPLDEARMAIRAAWERAAAPVAQAVPQAVPQQVAARSHRRQRRAAGLRRVLQAVNSWVDRVDQGLFGEGAPARAMPRAQQGGLVRR